MLVTAMVTRVQEVERDGKTYHNLSLEGFGVAPGSELGELPKKGSTIKGTIQVYWPENGGRPVHFLTDWRLA